MKLFGNFIYLAGAEVISKSITFAAFAYIARMVGPAGMGGIEFASAVLLVAALAVDMGFGSYGAREIAKDASRTPELVGQIIFLRLVLGGAAYAGIIGLALTVNRGAANANLLVLFGLSLLGLPFLMQWVFQGYEWMGAVAALNLLRQVTFAIFVFLFLRGPGDLLIVAGAEIAGVTMAAVAGVWWYRRRFQGGLRLTARASRDVLVQGATIGLAQVFWSVKMFGATVVVGLLAAPDQVADVGFFGGAMRILVALHAFIWLYYFNLLPAMTRAWRESQAALGQLVGESMIVMGWAALTSGLLWVVLGPTVIRVAYGTQFGPAGPVLQWMGGVAVLAGLSGHFRMGLIACGYQKSEMATAAAGAVTALILIPLGFSWGGPTGAAMGLVMAEGAVWLFSWALAVRWLGLEGHLTSLLRPLVGVCAVAFLLWLIPPLAVAWRALLGVVGLALAAGLLDPRMRGLVFRAAGLWPRSVIAGRGVSDARTS